MTNKNNTHVYEPMTKQPGFYLPASLKEKLKLVAKKRGVKIGEAIRQAIAEWVDK